MNLEGGAPPLNYRKGCVRSASVRDVPLSPRLPAIGHGFEHPCFISIRFPKWNANGHVLMIQLQEGGQKVLGVSFCMTENFFLRTSCDFLRRAARLSGVHPSCNTSRPGGVSFSGCSLMVDIHSHAVPGLDDGPNILEEALQVAEMAITDRISQVIAPPNANDTYQFLPEMVQRCQDEIQARLGK